MLRRTLLVAGFVGLAAAPPSFAEELKEINIGVLSTDTTAALKKMIVESDNLKANDVLAASAGVQCPLPR